MNETIIGNNILLRPITREDTDLIVKWRRNPLVRQNFIYRGDITRESHLRWLKEKVDTREVVQFIIEEIVNNNHNPVGSVYFKDIDYNNSSAEYGIFIGEDSARGKGYGTEVAKLFTNYGINTLGLHRIMLRLISTNEIAYKSYLCAGFKIEGTAREMVKIDGTFKDVIFMSLLAGEEIL
jgi:Acetyltransferases, including N-acetylases of ribosomal proteins